MRTSQKTKDDYIAELENAKNNMHHLTLRCKERYLAMDIMEARDMKREGARYAATIKRLTNKLKKDFNYKG